MDRKNQSPMGERGRVFTETEYREDARSVVAYATVTGCAIVADAAGNPRVVISIPTHDLPTLDPLD